MVILVEIIVNAISFIDEDDGHDNSSDNDKKNRNENEQAAPQGQPATHRFSLLAGTTATLMLFVVLIMC